MRNPTCHVAPLTARALSLACLTALLVLAAYSSMPRIRRVGAEGLTTPARGPEYSFEATAVGGPNFITPSNGNFRTFYAGSNDGNFRTLEAHAQPVPPQDGGRDAPDLANNTPRPVTTVKAAQGQNCTRSWEGDAPEPGESNLWQNRKNWSGDELPGMNDDVCIGGGFNVTFSSPGGLTTIRSLTCEGALTITKGARLEFRANSQINGTLTLGSDAPDPSLGTLHGAVDSTPQTMMLAGAFNWIGGTLSGDGVFNANGGITISGVLGKELRGPTLNNPNTANWSGTGNIAIGGRFNNTGTFNANNSAQFFLIGTTEGFFNPGTFNKAGGGGTTSFLDSVPFHNSGTVSVQSGVLELRGGGTSTGRFVTGSDGNFIFLKAGSYELNGANFSGGPIVLDGAFVTLGGEVAVNQFWLISGNLAGAGTLNVSGALRWLGGSMTGTGVTNANGTLEIRGSAGKELFVRTLNNTATATWDGTGNVGMGGGAIFNNTGTFNVNTGADFPHTGGSPAKFNNQGNFNKSNIGGQTSVFSNVEFNNTGMVSVNSDAEQSLIILALNGGGTTTGFFQAGRGGVVIIGGGTYILDNARFLGGGAFVIDGGTVEVRGSVAVSNFSLNVGTLTGEGILDIEGSAGWLSGTMAGSGVTRANGGMFLGSVLGKILQQRTLNTRGTVTWTNDGNIGMAAGAVFNNFGNFTVENDRFFGVVGADSGTFNNFGTFTKSGSSGTTTFRVPFVNTGTASAASGIINFSRGYNQTAGSLVLTAGSTIGNLDIEGGNVGGDGNHNGNVNNNGGTAGPGRSPGRLNITGNYTQGASGGLDIEIGGPSAGQFDQLAVSNAANLGGTLNISLLGGFQPAVGDTFTILTYASRSGTFAAISGLTLPGGRSFELDFGADRLTLITRDAPGSSLVQFNASIYTVAENAGHALITVTRTGDLSNAVTVDYATSDGAATERSDYTTAVGNLRFAAGETSKTFTVLLTDDLSVESDETVNLTLSNPTGGVVLGSPNPATLTITNNDTSPPASNPIEEAQFFVERNYHDFLNREPDASGKAFWIDQITSCGADTQCRDIRRINVSAAFFLSIEFQETGFLVYRAHQAAFDTGPAIGFRDFLRDTQDIGRGVVVGQAGWEQLLEANTQAFFSEFINRPQFMTRYPLTMTPAQYVDGLNANTGGSLSQAERDALVAGLVGGTQTRATVLRAAAEDADFRAREFNRAFVFMQYVGYLRREPDDPPDMNFDGFNFWLAKLNQFNGNFIQAEMVKAFIDSGEYRGRFGP